MQLVSLGRIKSRIRGIENIAKITNVMELISAAKLKAVERSLKDSRNYLAKLESLLNNLAGNAKEIRHPLLLAKEKIENVVLSVVTSDTGLCASYNNNILRAAESFIREFAPKNVKLIIIGRKGYGYFKKSRYPILEAYAGARGAYSARICQKFIERVTGIFLSGEADAVYLAYTHFHSASRYAPSIKKLLNVEYAKTQDLEYIIEPDLEGVMDKLVPGYLFNKARACFQEALTSEHAARVLAMGQANDNAGDLLDSLLLLRNKIRQANITRDIMEIVSSAEALKR